MRCRQAMTNVHCNRQHALTFKSCFLHLPLLHDLEHGFTWSDDNRCFLAPFNTSGVGHMHAGTAPVGSPVWSLTQSMELHLFEMFDQNHSLRLGIVLMHTPHDFVVAVGSSISLRNCLNMSQHQVGPSEPRSRPAKLFLPSVGRNSNRRLL